MKKVEEDEKWFIKQLDCYRNRFEIEKMKFLFDWFIKIQSEPNILNYLAIKWRGAWKTKWMKEIQFVNENDLGEESHKLYFRFALKLLPFKVIAFKLQRQQKQCKCAWSESNEWKNKKPYIRKRWRFLTRNSLPPVFKRWRSFVFSEDIQSIWNI